MTSASAARDAFAFLRRCWTGEDMTWASGAGGCLMLVGILWLVETIGSNALRAFGLGEPVATVGGWAIAGTYLVLGGIHDWRALHRREARQAARRLIQTRLRLLGVEGLVRASGRLVHRDLDTLGEPRRLWRVDDEFGDPLVVALEVRNSSLDPDGSRQTYFIRVPPDMTTCRAAVAWTFGLAAHQYDPIVES
jgi:hypothetical protein